MPDAAANLVAIAKNNCERLIRLINDILDIEKIESGQMRIDSQVVELRPLVEQAIVANASFAACWSVTPIVTGVFCVDATVELPPLGTDSTGASWISVTTTGCA